MSRPDAKLIGLSFLVALGIVAAAPLPPVGPMPMRPVTKGAPQGTDAAPHGPAVPSRDPAVLMFDDQIIGTMAPVGNLTGAQRAAIVRSRLASAPCPQRGEVTVPRVGNHWAIYVRDTLIVTVTREDARLARCSDTMLAWIWSSRLNRATMRYWRG